MPMFSWTQTPDSGHVHKHNTVCLNIQTRIVMWLKQSMCIWAFENDQNGIGYIFPLSTIIFISYSGLLWFKKKSKNSDWGVAFYSSDSDEIFFWSHLDRNQ